jgi:hypothetical protein
MRMPLVLCVLVPLLLGARSFEAPDLAAVERAQKKAREKQTLAERIVVVTEPFLGAPYAVSPLGEGEGASEDADPRLRFDAFDCTTFVETALALALTDDVTQARELLDAIRYEDKQTTFLKRRHFPEAEWIPQLAELGFLADVTRTIGGEAVTEESKVLNPAVWDRRKRPSHLELPEARIPDGTFTLDVWPLDDARAGQKKIPAGTLLNLVRVDFKGVPGRVSHQGIVIEKGGKQYLRHAADRMFHSVVDEPLDHFFLRMQKYKKWPVRGVNLATLRAPENYRKWIANAKPTPPPPAGRPLVAD